MMALVNKILEESIEMFVTGSTDHMQEIMDLENAIDDMELVLTNKHIKRLQEGKCTAYAGIYYKDILSGLERVGDHAINIAFSLVEAKNGKQGTAVITQ